MSENNIYCDVHNRIKTKDWDALVKHTKDPKGTADRRLSLMILVFKHRYFGAYLKVLQDAKTKWDKHGNTPRCAGLFRAVVERYPTGIFDS